MNDSTSISSNMTSFHWDKMFPDILWILFWLIVLCASRNFLKTAITSLLNRLKHGAGVKIGAFELDALTVTTASDIKNPKYQVSKDISGQREKERTAKYAAQRGIMLVHKIFKSLQEGQLYDILIYIIPHRDSNLIQVTKVDYFFGEMWHSHIFSANDRSNGFAIATCAYGPFLCSAKVYFNDGTSQTIFRYIDFEMGDVAAMTKSEE